MSSSLIETSTGEYRMCCPYCEEKGRGEDTGYHLYVNVKRGLYFCHRCESKGKSQDIEHRLHSVSRRVDVPEMIEEVKEKINPTALKPDYTYFNPDHLGKPPVEGTPSWAYLTKLRGLSPDQIRYYDLRSGFGEEMRGRIVVPIFDANGHCIYYSGRAYNDRKPKYRNPDVDKKNIIFHLHGVKTDYVIVCEGVFSAIHAGYSAIAVLGKYLSRWQFSAIGRRWKKIYLALDGDVLREDERRSPKEKKIPRIVSRFQRMGCAVGVVPLPGKSDPEDARKAGIFEDLLQQTQLEYRDSSNPQIKIPVQRRFYKR